MKLSIWTHCFLAAGFVFGIARAAAPEFTVTSPDFGPGHPIAESHVFNEYGCKGLNHSPALEWRGAPAGTKSFAITLFDLDEHSGPSGWWHWVVYDVPASTTRLLENAGAVKSEILPKGAVQGRTDVSQDAYHGPCLSKDEPPHRYQITIYALSIENLPVPSEATGAMVTWTAHDYTLAKATLTARYPK